MNKIEHIGIAVEDLKASEELFEKLLGKPPYKREEVPSEGVVTSFFQCGPNKIELLASTDPEGPIAKFIKKKGEGIHHMALKVENMELEIKRLKSEGFILIQDVAKTGADNQRICFLHPKSTNGVLIELCEQIKKME